MTHAINGRHTDNWWLEEMSSVVVGTGASSQEIQGTETVDSAATAAKVMKSGGIHETTPTVVEDGKAAVNHYDTSQNLSVTQGTLLAGEDLTNNVMKIEERVSYANISASTLVKTGAGRLFGFVVNSHTNGTLKLWDNTSAATTVMFNTITFAAGPNFIKLPGAVEFEAGLFAEIGGTADITILYR